MSSSTQGVPSHSDFPIAKTSSLVPHEEVPTGSDPNHPLRVNTETHDLYDGLMKGELQNGKLDYEEQVAEIAIPEDAVPFDGDALYAILADDDGNLLYDTQNKRWRGFPGHQNPKESIPHWLETLAKAVHEFVLRENPSAKRTFWSDAFEKRPIPDPHCNCQPDGVDVDLDMDSDYFIAELLKSWRYIKQAFEAKAGFGARSETFLQSAGSARRAFNNQLDRRYFVGYTLNDDYLTVIGFDRSGWVASPPFNIHDDPGLFLHIIVGGLYLQSKDFGKDPTVEIDENGKGRILVGEEWYEVVKVIHVEGVLRGRATICYHVRKDGVDYVVKDYWVDMSREDKEAEVLEKLKGIDHVPEIIDDVPVMFNGKPDTTAHFRPAKEGEYPKGTYKGVEIRAHRRILLKPLARKLSDFRSLVELVRAIRDVVACIQKIFEAGYIHRDISIANVMLEQLGEELRGLLIDYDYAIDKNRAETQAMGRRTGTLPFMAIDILEAKATTAHGYQHDLESLFYVFIWVCTMQNGPNGQLRDTGTFKYKKSVLSVWNGGLHSSTVPFEVVALSKRAVMYDPGKFESDILNCFAPYFAPLRPYMESLRKLLFPPILPSSEVSKVHKHLHNVNTSGVDPDVVRILRGLMPSTLEGPEHLFDSMKSILDDAIEKLTEEGHAEIIPPPTPTTTTSVPIDTDPQNTTSTNAAPPNTAPTNTEQGSYYVLHPVDLGVVTMAGGNALATYRPAGPEGRRSQGQGHPNLKRRSDSEGQKASSSSSKKPKTTTNKRSQSSYYYVDPSSKSTSPDFSSSTSSFQVVDYPHSSGGDDDAGPSGS